jgi:cytochrome c-type biogenesis protein CcmF
VINNLLLSVLLGIVFYGTLYPLVAQAFGHDVSVGAPYFNAYTGPIALFLVALMALGPMLRWRRDKLRETAGRVAIPALLSVATLLLVLTLAPGTRVLPMFGLAVAVGVGVASLAPLWKRNLRRTPLFTYGMVISHLGIAVALAGMACESAFTKETLAAVSPGQTVRVAGFSVKYNGAQPVTGPNYTAVRTELEVRRGDGEPFYMYPEARLFSTPPSPTSEAAIRTMWDGQLYLAAGDPTDLDNQGGRRQVRLWWKPMVTLIWFGGFLIAFGGFLALVGRLRRDRRNKAAPDDDATSVEPEAVAV